MPKQIGIILVDDHQIVREGFALMLLGDTRFKIIGQADSEASLYGLLRKGTPDVFVLDISLKQGANGIDICKQLKKDYPKIPTLFLTANSDHYYISAARKANGDGFLSKDTDSESFKKALVALSEGEKFWDEVLLQKIDQEESFKTTLTMREVEVIECIAKGNTQKEIGELLHISPRTVETHKKNILAKLNLKSTADLVRFAIREKIIEA